MCHGKRVGVTSAIDALLESAADWEERFEGTASGVPARHVAIVTCMDARIDPAAIFGLRPGEAHVLRNAGGIVTDDVLRSLVLSQRALGTREVLLMHHERCGVDGLDELTLREEIAGEAGAEPSYGFEAFAGVEDAVRRAVARVREHPFLPHRDAVRGFVYEVTTGALREVV